MARSFSDVAIANYKLKQAEEKRKAEAAKKAAAAERRAAARAKMSEEDKLKARVKALKKKVEKGEEERAKLEENFAVLSDAANRLYERAAAALREKGVEDVNAVLLR